MRRYLQIYLRRPVADHEERVRVPSLRPSGM